jgi:transposase
MQTHEFFNLLLDDIDDVWRVKEVKTNVKTKEIDIFLEYTSNKGESPDTGQEFPIYDHREMRRWRHLDTLEYKTFLNAQVPRIKDEDGKVKTIKIPWASNHERNTYKFEKVVIDLLQATKNQTRTAYLVNCGFNVVNRIMHRATQRGLWRRSSQITFAHLGIDEKAFKKGHNYMSVLTHPDTGCVLDVVQGRDKKTSKALLDQVLTAEQKAQVKSVSMDMWKPYIDVVYSELPGSEPIHDRFHMVKHLNEAVDQVRRKEVKKYEDLKHTRYLWLKGQDKLTDKQWMKFKWINEMNYEVCFAWRVKENFKEVFKEPSWEEVVKLYSLWMQNAIKTGLKEITKVVDRFKNHLKGVLNGLASKKSNAIAERLNGKIQEIKLSGRGYRRFENLRSAILFFHGGLSLYP